VIGEKTYRDYLKALLAGRRLACRDMVQLLIDADIDLKVLYTELFQRSLYEVGALWETNRITVANEHLATAITESLLSLAYPRLFATERTGRKAVISCSANEYHQVGGKMVADIFELNGWDGHFLGANTPADAMPAFIHEVQPDVVGLSLSLPSNIEHLKRAIETIRSDFPKVDLLVGGQAFRWGIRDAVKQSNGTEYISSLADLERKIKGG